MWRCTGACAFDSAAPRMGLGCCLDSCAVLASFIPALAVAGVLPYGGAGNRHPHRRRCHHVIRHMLLAPLSRQAFALPFTFIIDPWFTAILVIGLAAGSLVPRKRYPSILAFVVLGGYVGF